MLEIKNISVSVNGKEILKNVSISAKKGEIHAIIGPNGAGKSTLGQILLGASQFTQTNGEIFFENEQIDSLPTHKRAQKGLFLSFQTPPMLEGIKTKDFIFGAKKQLDPGFHSSFRLQKQLKTILNDLSLNEEFLERGLNEGASGGERKKMEIATLLTLNPKCAFLDEIDSGVDIDALKKIAEKIKEFVKNNDKILIIVSHTEKFLDLLSPTHIHVLKNGEIIKQGSGALLKEIHQKGFENL